MTLPVNDRQLHKGMTAKAVFRYLIVAFAAAGVVFLWFFNPTEIAWAPKCAVHAITGLQCPGCGISRAIHALLHGHFYEALAYNWFFVISVPYLLSVCAVMSIPALYRRERLRYAVTGQTVAWIYVTLFCVWFVVRNIYGI